MMLPGLFEPGKTLKWEVPSCPGDGPAYLHWFRLGAPGEASSLWPHWIFPLRSQKLPSCHTSLFLTAVTLVSRLFLFWFTFLFHFLCFFFNGFVSLGAAGVTGAEIGWFSGGSRNWTTLLLCDVQVHTSCFLIYKNKSNFLQEVCYDKRVCWWNSNTVLLTSR